MKKRFLNTFLITVFASSLISAVSFEIFSAGLRRVHQGFQGKLNYLLNGTEHYDAVFIGASRMFTGINPMLFDSLTKLNSYNAGIEGAAIAETSVFLHKFIESHGAPKFLFLGVEENVLITKDVWDFPRFLPYFGQRDIFELYKYQPEIFYSRYFPSLAITYYDDSRKTLALEGFVANQKAYEHASTKGFQPLDYSPQPNLTGKAFENYLTSKDGLQILSGICEYCRDNNIKLILVVPPLLISKELVGKTAPSFKKISDIAQSYHVPTIDIGHEQAFTDPNLFWDGMHVIVKGSNLFTGMVAEQFNQLRQQADKAY